MKFLHFITQSYSIGILQPLIEEINRINAGQSLVYLDSALENSLAADIAFTRPIKEAIAFKPDILFTPGNIVHYRIPGLKVHVFHGLCEEKKGHCKINGLFDLYCTCGFLIT